MSKTENAAAMLTIAEMAVKKGKLTTQELTHLFEPFYRGDAARSRATGGTGLGLAIVRTAAAAHGGTCWAENRAGGVRIWMELPALQSV